MLGKNRIKQEENGITFVPEKDMIDWHLPMRKNALINYKATSSPKYGMSVNPSIAVEANEAQKQVYSLWPSILWLSINNVLRKTRKMVIIWKS